MNDKLFRASFLKRFHFRKSSGPNCYFATGKLE